MQTLLLSHPYGLRGRERRNFHSSHCQSYSLRTLKLAIHSSLTTPAKFQMLHCLSNPVKTMADTYLRQIQQAASNTWHVDCACADSWLTKLTHSTKKVHELLHIFHQTWLLYLMSVAKSDVQILHFLVSTRASRLIICFPINCIKHLSIRSSYKSIII